MIVVVVAVVVVVAFQCILIIKMQVKLVRVKARREKSYLRNKKS
jgi:hypothetical protein